MTAAALLLSFVMVVNEVVCVEVDPVLVGDVCVVLAQGEPLGHVALVTGTDPTMHPKAGDELALTPDGLTPVDDPRARRLLAAAVAASDPAHLFWWDGRLPLSSD